MQKKLLMGNEAIARGAVEAGVAVAAAYPGTPSSEVFAELAKYAREYGFYAEWSANEKAALEVAAGAAYAGARAIVSMKQVGLNVAADPLMTLAYIGVRGGLVLVVADDPGPHSSQNEQDTRKFAAFAKLPVFDPATPQEAKDMVISAFELSEQLGLPVILRPTTRTCHVCQDVTVSDIQKIKKDYKFEKDPRWVILPRMAYIKHKELNAKQEQVRAIFEKSPFNTVEPGGSTGIIAGGVSYNYVKEALARLQLEASVLKIGTPYPLPEKLVIDFLGQVGRVLVVEEQEGVIEEQVIKLMWRHKLNPSLSGKHDGFIPREGELNVNILEDRLAEFFGLPKAEAKTAAVPELPVRPPTLCAGCPHRASFYAVKEAVAGTDAIFTGDIGCYTLGNAPPLNAVDTCLCMGAGITIAQGLSRVDQSRPAIAFIGDSTFFHSGLTGLVNAVYNQTNITIVILDNETTAMTGFQPHPGTGLTAVQEQHRPLDIPAIVRACGVAHVLEADPYQLDEAMKAAREAISFPGPSVVIMRRQCVSLNKHRKKFRINEELCNDCGLCTEKLGCPAIFREDGFGILENCSGCGVCAQICPFRAIEEVLS